MNYRRFVFLLALSLAVILAGCSSTQMRRSLGETIDDAVITNKLKTKFLKDKMVKAFQIDIDTWKGVVSLRGRVESQDQIYRAIEITEQQAGVKEVKSYLVLRDAAEMAQPSSRKNRAVVEEKDVAEEKPVVKKEAASEKTAAPPADDAETESSGDSPDDFEDDGVPQVTPE
ncbi:MAG: BON domain-containing protein [Deltaproteobacteria bacterium]|nr:BON domain-containing protein [Deltaproteobacteria bacterium]